MLGATPDVIKPISSERPRGSYVAYDGSGEGGEVELDTWATFASDDLLRQVVVERAFPFRSSRDP